MPIRGDFALYKNNTLYIGDFCLAPFYRVKDNNPLLLAYTDYEVDYNKPEYIISLPKMVQGMEIDNDGNMYFTTSFTYLINSKLLKYNNVLNNTADTYKLGKKDLVKSYTLPPMAEGMYFKGNKLYVLFESSSDGYLPALPKID